MPDTMTVEQIQDLVECKLMESDYKDVAKAYIIYRDSKAKCREEQQAFDQIIGEKLKATNVQNQNANVDEKSFGGRKGEACSEMMRKYALDHLVSDMAKKNHVNNMIYIHDLDSYAVGEHNCLTLPFDDLLANGFTTRQTDVRPANSVNTAFQLLAVLFQLQSLQQFGGVAASHLDWTMVPYVRKSFIKHYDDGMKYFDGDQTMSSDVKCKMLQLPIDHKHFKQNEKVWQYAMDKTTDELNQAVEGMYHNLNTLQSRSGNQLPFTSINYGTCTLPEGRMVIKALLEGSIKGVGKLRKTPVFPCSIFQCMKGVNREAGDPNYDLFKLALKSTALRLYPNYVNVDWSGNKGYDVNDPRTYMATMGCRTANGYDINGLGQLKDGRGNICPVTIILPTIAMEAKRAVHHHFVHNQNVMNNSAMVERLIVKTFMNLLDNKIEQAKDMLIERFEYICSQSAESARFMYENNTMAGYVPEEGIRSALKHGTLALGQLGLAEALQLLIGCNHTTEKGMQLAKDIEELFAARCDAFKEHYKLNFGVYYSPAENLCHTAMKKFKEKYGVIEGVSDHEYFTNSMHVPVWEKVSVFEKINIESQLTGYSRAGCITYVELESSVKNNIDALETYVNYAMDHDIPYFAINVPNDTCLECGYTDEFNDECPMCHSKNIQQLRRVTGYLTGNYTTAFNKGKQAEVRDRVKHRGK
jgi:ribonucleoside-triphosphate reductase